MFHGLCLLKYTIFKQQSGVRYSPPQVVPVASHSKSGYIGIVILPNFGTVEARLIGSHMIKIKEDEKNPTCFKVMLHMKIQQQFASFDFRDGVEIICELRRRFCRRLKFHS